MNLNTIFLVEDDLNIRRLTGMHLQLAGYDVRELEDAGEARDALRKERPSLVLLDGDLWVDYETREVWRNGRPVSMTTLEFNLLKALIESGRTAMSREDLLTAVWGYHYTGETRTVDVHIQRLRGKIGTDRIETIVRYGYRFREES